MEWNSKSRRRYLEAILHLSPEDRRKDRGASWGSIQDVFLHIIEDYMWWFENVPQGKGEDQFVALVGREVDEGELRSLTRRAEETVQRYMVSLTPEDLGRPYVVHGTSGGGKEYTMTHVSR